MIRPRKFLLGHDTRTYEVPHDEMVARSKFARILHQSEGAGHTMGLHGQKAPFKGRHVAIMARASVKTMASGKLPSPKSAPLMKSGPAHSR